MSEMPVVDTELRCFERPFSWESIDAVVFINVNISLKKMYLSGYYR